MITRKLKSKDVTRDKILAQFYDLVNRENRSFNVAEIRNIKEYTDDILFVYKMQEKERIDGLFEEQEQAKKRKEERMKEQNEYVR